MKISKIFFRPLLEATFIPAIEYANELDENCNKAEVVLGPHIFEMVRSIIQTEKYEKQSAFYATITDAALGGADFSQVKSIKDISKVYARFVVKRALG